MNEVHPKTRDYTQTPKRGIGRNRYKYRIRDIRQSVQSMRIETYQTKGRYRIQNLLMQVLPEFKLVCTGAGLELEGIDILYTFPLIGGGGGGGGGGRLGNGSGDP